MKNGETAGGAVSPFFSEGSGRILELKTYGKIGKGKLPERGIFCNVILQHPAKFPFRVERIFPDVHMDIQPPGTAAAIPDADNFSLPDDSARIGHGSPDFPVKALSGCRIHRSR